MVRGSTILRIGLGLVFAYFSAMQFINPVVWTSFLPRALQGANAMLLVYLNASLDGVLALTIGFGVFPKVAPFIGFLHLLGIAITMGLNDVAVRDFGLSMACLSLVFIQEEHLTGRQRRIMARIFGRH